MHTRCDNCILNSELHVQYVVSEKGQVKAKKGSVLVKFQADCFVRHKDTESTQSDVLWFTCFSWSFIS